MWHRNVAPKLTELVPDVDLLALQSSDLRLMGDSLRGCTKCLASLSRTLLLEGSLTELLSQVALFALADRQLSLQCLRAIADQLRECRLVDDILKSGGDGTKDYTVHRPTNLQIGRPDFDHHQLLHVRRLWRPAATNVAGAQRMRQVDHSRADVIGADLHVIVDRLLAKEALEADRHCALKALS